MSGQPRFLFQPEAIEEIQRAYQRWEREALKQELSPCHTESGIPVKLLYTPCDIASLDYLAEVGFPGEPPFLRGIYPNMYRGRLFTVRQLAGFGSPEDCNKRIRFLLEHGATGVNIVFDLPTIRGYDSDDPEAEGNVGQCGVAIDSIQDIEALFEGVPIEKLSVSLVTHLPSVTTALFSMYLVMAQNRGIPLTALAGTTQNDFLMETVIGSAPEVIPPRHSFRLQCDVVEYSSQNLPRWNPISLNGYNLREAGTDAVAEVGVAIANAIATAEELIARGREIDSFAPRISFFWDLCNDFFEEIAKCRASRRVWYEVIRQRFKARNPRSWHMRFHVQTSGISLTRVEPYNNIARAAIQGLAAVLGGAQSLHIDSYDEAYSAPTEESALVSLRTQQILQVETGITKTVDPLAGSYYLEHLTAEIEKRIHGYIEKIQQLGGIVAAVESGWLHQEIANHAYQQQKAIEAGTRQIVGVNYLPRTQHVDIQIFDYPETQEKQKYKLAELRRQRDSREVAQCLKQIELACRRGQNVMLSVMEAVRAKATLGEIEGVFREQFGRWQLPLLGW